jgi:ACS family hexuronate transporter-like MFS transporter
MERTGKGLKPRSAGRVRWWIVWTLFFSTVINYISRQTFSLLVPVISAQYHLTNADLGKIFAAFQVSYAVTWLLGGIFLDAVGTRLGLALAVVFWSVVNIFTGFASSVFGFAFFRFLLGIGEGFNWPGASKTVAEWFPSQERSLAVAIFDSGSSVGGAVAALSIPLIAIEFGWRSAFVFSGAIGFVWLLMWLRVYHLLDDHPRVTPEEVALIRAGQDVPVASAQRGVARWLNLAGNRNVWGIVLGRALTDPIWWFYIAWLPKYLSDARGFSLQRIAIFAWMPFIAADLGNFTGGLISGYCIRRGMPVVRDLFPQDVVATVTGLSGLAAGLVGAVFTIAVGFLVDRFSFGPAFLVAGLMPLFATACLLLLVRAPASTAAS